MFDPKKGDKVACCYDGKFGRYTFGTVLQRRGFALQVEFPQWAGEGIAKCWFVRLSDEHFGGFLRVADSFMRLFGSPGDWYSVVPSNHEDIARRELRKLKPQGLWRRGM